MADEVNTPLEYTIDASAEQAAGGLDRIVQILEDMKGSVGDIASYLSKIKGASDATASSFQKIQQANDRAFDTKRILDFSKRMVTFEQIAKKLSKSGNVDELAISKAMKSGIAEANRLNTALNTMDTASPEFGAASDSLQKQIASLEEMATAYNDIAAARKAAADADWDKKARAAMERSNRTDVDPSVDMEKRFADKESRSGWKQYSVAEIAKEMESAAGNAGRIEKILRGLTNVEIKNPVDLAKAQAEYVKLGKQIEQAKNKVIEMNAAGDTAGAKKQAAKVSVLEAGYKKFGDAIRVAEPAWEEVHKNSDIKIESIEDWQAAEATLKRLKSQLISSTAAMKQFGEAGDAVGFEKMRAKANATSYEIGRYEEAMTASSSVGTQMRDVASLEEVYKRIDKLRSQIDAKGAMGKTSFNSSAVTKLKVDLNEAERDAVRLQMALGQIGKEEGLVKNSKLTVQGFIQARLHAARLNDEMKKSRHTLLSVSRVLQLMALRAAVRAITKDLNAGFATLADQYEPFNDAMSDMMDSVTRVRNSLVSAFDPLIRTVAPIAVRVLDQVAVGFDKIAQAAAAMTGATTYVKLTSEAQDYADTVNEVKNSLAGFDKFNTIGDRTSGNGEKFKTTVDPEAPIDEAFLKWKHIGEGLKDVWEGVEEVIDSVVDKLADMLGVADNEDAFKAVGDWLSGLGDGVKKYDSELADFLITLAKFKIAMKGISAGSKLFSTVKGGIATAKGLGAAGKAAASTVAGKVGGASIGAKISAILAKLSAGSASAAPAGTLATAGTSAAALGAIRFGLLGISSYIGAKYLEPKWDSLNETMREYAKAQSGEDKSTFASWGVFAKNALNRISGGGNETDPQTRVVVNDRAPGGFRVNTANVRFDDTAITNAVSVGVERAMTSAMKSGGGFSVNIKATADKDKLFKFVVEENNSQYNRTGRSPLKV